MKKIRLENKKMLKIEEIYNENPVISVRDDLILSDRYYDEIIEDRNIECLMEIISDMLLESNTEFSKIKKLLCEIINITETEDVISIETLHEIYENGKNAKLVVKGKLINLLRYFSEYIDNDNFFENVEDYLTRLYRYSGISLLECTLFIESEIDVNIDYTYATNIVESSIGYIRENISDILQLIRDRNFETHIKKKLEKELLILLEYAYSFSTYSSDVCAWTVFQDMLADL